MRELRTLADLGDRHAIYAFCDPCGRSVQLNAARLAALYGAEFTIAELRHRLTCHNCRARPRQIRIVYTLSPR